MSVCLSIYLSICKLENQAILRDVLRFWTWQHQKRSNSARLPQCLNLTTSKTKKSARLLHFSKLTTSKTNQFCETSSIFELNRNNSARLLHFSNLTTSKTKQFCETSFKNGKLRAALVPMRFAFFSVHLSKLPGLPRKSDARSYEVLHLSRKIISANLKIWCSKIQSLSGKSAPWPPNISDEHVSCTAPATENASLQILFKCPATAIVFGNATKPSRFAHFWEGERPKVVRTPGVFNMLTSKCASRHNGVHFFDISTSKRGPSGPGVFCTFWLQNVLRATTATLFQQRNFQVLGTCGVLCILTWKCASHHNGVQFFISHLARWLRARRFSEPTDRPSGATNHWRNIALRDFPTFSPTCIFFLLTLSLLWSSLFCSSLLSDSSHLCFSSVHILRSLTSKLPSSIYIFFTYIYVCVSSYDPNPMHDVLNMSRCPKFRWPRLLSTKSQKLDELRNFVPEAEAGAVLRSARLERLVRLQFQWIY